MKKIIDIPHRTSDFTCPVNGLCDIYEWKNQQRIDENVVLGIQSGFAFISNKNSVPPKMIFLGYGIGKKLFEFWKPIMKYDIYFKENRSFKYTIRSAKDLLDKDIPVILYGLDMYHLPFQKSYYHKVHIEGHVILLVGYDEEYLYIHDNSKENVEKITYCDLEKAWEKDFAGVCKKFTYFGIEIKEKTERNLILKEAFNTVSDFFLKPPVSFLGIKGYDKLIDEIESWDYSDEEMKEIFKNFIYFTASIIPELPKELDPNSPNISKAHKGARDKTSIAINKYGKEYEIANYETICKALDKSGSIIEKINKEMVKDILSNNYTDLKKYSKLFAQLKAAECHLFSNLSY